MRTFLLGLGFSKYEAEKLISVFGEQDILNLLETPEGRNELSGIVDSSSVRSAHIQYCRIWTGTKVFSSLEPFGVPTEIAYQFFCSCGGDNEEGKTHGENEENAEQVLRADPYTLVFDYTVSFRAADQVAKLVGYSDDSERTEAAVYSALLLAEHGSEDHLRDKAGSKIAALAGSTCLPVGELISITESMLEDVSSEDILAAANRLHHKKKILLTRKTLHGTPVMLAYRSETAAIEFGAAAKIRERLSFPVIRYSSNPYAVIDDSQAALGLYLSYEQVNAVHTALTSKISVITGGPGTGKTQTTKVLLEAYRRLSHNGKVLLMAPTGQAAKRMETATGYPAATIHSALGIFPGETDSRNASDLKAGIVIIDEASMVDAQLLFMLLDHISTDTIIVVIGDVDQLPSIGAGNVLSELKLCVPVSRLTKIFRQSGDAADIAYNAARINAGATQMIESDRFTFIEAKGSSDTQKAVCKVFKEQTEEVGLENVVVLSPLRRKTMTGVNQLNRALRKVCTDSSRYVTCGDNCIYLNDKIVFLKNRYGLSNGSIGFVTKVGSDSAECMFGDKRLTLSGSQLSWIVPAYAETIHKSQGDEYKVVILVSDSCHAASTKSMIYTAVTRAKERIFIVGERNAFEKACLRDSGGRISALSTLVMEG